ncbi:DNA primase [Arsukibacterium tuosuense]|uniref:DNA primase n=1 Tax=Arsukibacterium tuosuense TaxID=1323745 RepID=A0A285IYW6_9GAMM|nr:DNA primase [Arsukibacterium tuosuense]SNY52286.1 DNA primase [Arsukibacterium tuosuense]
MAGQIPRQFIDDLLARTDIVELIDQRVPLKKAGSKNYAACCPFHNEKSPSFTVSPDKQFYHCFGCGAHGNAISFMMEFEQLEFVEAIEELAKQLHMEVPREQGKGPARPAAQADDYSLMQQAADFYQQQLQQHANGPTVQQYLQKRGLSPQTINDFQLGYAPDGWDGVLKQLSNGKPRAVREQLIELKLVNRNDNGREYDFFRDRLMFPIHDKRGRVIAFGGRILNDGQPKYLNSPETRLFHKGRELYGLYQVRQQPGHLKQVLVVEGYMDVVALAEHDIRFAVACLGTATTSDQMHTLFRYSPKVICCYDGDRAGRDAAWRALQNALPQLKDGVELNFVFLPDGEDPDSLVQKEGKAAFLARLEQALPLSQYLFEHLLQEFDANTDGGKSALMVKGSELIKQIPSSFYQETLQQKLNNLLGRASERLKPVSNRPQARPAPASIKMTPMRRAIALLLQTPELVNVMPHAPELASADIPGINLLLAVQQHLLDKPGLTTAQLLEYWRDLPEHAILLKLAAWQHQIEPEQLSAEFLDTFHSIEDQYLQQRLEALERKDKLKQLTQTEQREYVLLLKALKSKKPRPAS